MDAIFSTEDGKTYVFSGSKYWLLSEGTGCSLSDPVNKMEIL
jgi:YHS domain-containing protein